MMEFAGYFPVWSSLTAAQQNEISGSISCRTVKKGTMIHNGSRDCTGLLLIQKGQLRAYILSDEGKEVTVYRLFDRDMCLFSASCIMRSIQFDITIEAVKDTRFWVIPPEVYKRLMEQSAALANYTNEVMAMRFTEVMWLIEQVMWKSFDKRLAAFLLEEVSLENTCILKMTHERIGNHLGTAREVVTRMLRYFQGEGMVKLARGVVEVMDKEKLWMVCGK